MHGNGCAQTHISFQQNVLAQFDINSYNTHCDTSAKENKYKKTFNYGAASKTVGTSLFLGMSSSFNEKIHISTAMLLVPNENSATIDKRELRNLGIQHVNILTSGIEAANILAKLNAKDAALLPQVILCQEQLADMSSSEFVILIRNHPQFLGIPVLSLASSHSIADEVNALASGFSALLVRPYSSTVLRETILEAECQALFIEKLKQIHMPTTIDKFDNALKKINYVKSIEHIPMEYFKEGLNSLRQKKWDHAISIFQKSIRQSGIKGNSELGLAAAHKGKLNMTKYKHYLNMACLTFAKNKQWNKARTVYVQLLKDDEIAPNPFIQLAEYFIKDSKFDEAASSVVAGHDLGRNKNMAKIIINTCSLLNAPDDAIKVLMENLRSMDMPDLSLQIQEQIILDELNKIKREKEEKQNLLRQINTAKNLRTENILSNLSKEDKELVGLIANKKVVTAEDKEIVRRIANKKEAIANFQDMALDSLPEQMDADSLDSLSFDAGQSKGKKRPAALVLPSESPKNVKRTSMSKLSEVLTVAKMTWKFFKK